MLLLPVIALLVSLMAGRWISKISSHPLSLWFSNQLILQHPCQPCKPQRHVHSVPEVHVSAWDSVHTACLTLVSQPWNTCWAPSAPAKLCQWWHWFAPAGQTQALSTFLRYLGTLAWTMSQAPTPILLKCKKNTVCHHPHSYQPVIIQIWLH